MELWHGYRVTKILGIRYGYEGLVLRHGHKPLQLRPEAVSTIQAFGGTMLGTSRGPQNVMEMADGLQQLGIDILFVVGGDGTVKGAAALVEEIRRRGLRKFVHIPFNVVVGGRRRIDPQGDIWRSVLETTGQPSRMSNAA